MNIQTLMKKLNCKMKKKLKRNMKTYADLCSEFSTLQLAGKIVFLSDLSTDGLRTMLEGARQAPDDAYIKKWIKFIGEIITKRIAEDREKRLNDLGI